MKNNILRISFLFILTACCLGISGSSIHFTIKNKVKASQKWYVMAFNQLDYESAYKDSITTNGNSFTYNFDRDTIYAVSFYPQSAVEDDLGDYDSNRAINLILSKDMSFDVEAKSLADMIDFTVNGNDINADYAAYQAMSRSKFGLRMHNLSKEYSTIGENDTIKQQQINDEMEKFNAERSTFLSSYVNSNLDKDLSAYLLTDVPDSLFEVMCPKLSDSVRDGFFKPLLDAKTAEIKTNKEIEANNKKVADGIPAPDFTLKDINGKEVKLSDFRGKGVVLDFWGTWCYWCMKGIPEMRRHYQKLQSNVEFVSIDCMDKSIEKWKRVVKDSALYWTQLRNGVGDSDVAVLYGVQGYPTKIVIDSNGNIVKRFVGEVPEFYTTIDSLFEPKMPEAYDSQRLLEYVTYDMPEDGSDYLSAILDRVDKKVGREDFRERLKADLVCDFAENALSVDPKKYVDRVLADIKTDSLRQKVTLAYAQSKKNFGALWPGQPAPNIFFKDKTGKTLSLQDLRGKLLFIDIWGTWCVPCIEEIPYLKALYEKNKDNDKVLIMSIACDKQKDRQRWLNSLVKHKDMTWTQYQVTDEGNKILDSTYYVVGIPRFMVIAPDGKIVDSDAPRPSFENFNQYFSKIVEQYK